jgi:hypothetical protein
MVSFLSALEMKGIKTATMTAMIPVISTNGIDVMFPVTEIIRLVGMGR